jgi:AraC-like DNA-binding protein
MNVKRARIRAGRLPVAGGLASSAAAVGWLDFDAGVGAHNIHLPSDLYTVSLRCENPNGAPERGVCGVTAVVYSVREKTRRFVVTDRRRVVVAALTPLGMLKAFGFPAVELMDRPIPLEALCGEAAGHRLAAALHAASGLEERTRAFASWLEMRILGAGSPSVGAARVAQAAAEWSAHPTRCSIGDVARSLGIAVRQLERDFQRTLHVAPGAYRRIVKFQRAAADVAQGRRLLDVSAQHEFADQAHMTNVFRQFALLTPGELARHGTRPDWQLVRAGLAGRVFLLDMPPSADEEERRRDAPFVHSDAADAQPAPLLADA